METIHKSACYDRLEGLYSLYCQVRQAIILAENFNDDHKIPIAPINQLRNTLDHIFKSIIFAGENEKMDYEINEARSHLERAGYDALETLAGMLGKNVIKNLSLYSTETITTIFPEYYQTIIPRLTGIKNSIGILRSERVHDVQGSFSEYFDQFTELIEINKQVSMMIPSLEDYEAKTKKERNLERKRSNFITAVISLISAAISGLAVHFISGV